MSWRLDTEHWPGPDRNRWAIDRDVVVPSPDGQFACVLYSCGEIRISCEVGLLALLGGPPTAPVVLCMPPNFTCFDFSPRPSAQWLADGRFVVVSAYLYRPASNTIDLLAFTFLDTVNRAFAHHPTSLELVGKPFLEEDGEWRIRGSAYAIPNRWAVRVSPSKLSWRPWETLR